MNAHDLDQVLARLQTLFEQETRHEFERSNLIHDLKAVIDRLENDHYKASDFIARNKFDIPRRTEEYLQYLQGYNRVALTWSQLLHPLITDKTQAVLDLCPGWAPKIELALYDLDFSGNVFLWDLDTTSTARVIEFMRLFKTNFKLSSIDSDIFSSTDKIQTDFIVANHIIDDLLLYEYCKEQGLTLHEVYGSEGHLLTAIQNITQQGKSLQQKLTQNLVNFIETHLQVNGSIVLCHYAGLLESSKDLEHWVTFCTEIQKRIRDELVQSGYFDQQRIIASALDDSVSTYFSAENVICLKK